LLRQRSGPTCPGCGASSGPHLAGCPTLVCERCQPKIDGLLDAITRLNETIERLERENAQLRVIAA
jgi:outer membrane murein-binding lipoprotein Lpp